MSLVLILEGGTRSLVLVFEVSFLHAKPRSGTSSLVLVLEASFWYSEPRSGAWRLVPMRW